MLSDLRANLTGPDTNVQTTQSVAKYKATVTETAVKVYKIETVGEAVAKVKELIYGAGRIVVGDMPVILRTVVSIFNSHDRESEVTVKDVKEV